MELAANAPRRLSHLEVRSEVRGEMRLLFRSFSTNRISFTRRHARLFTQMIETWACFGNILALIRSISQALGVCALGLKAKQNLHRDRFRCYRYVSLVDSKSTFQQD